MITVVITDINVYNLSIKCYQNFFECFKCTDCPKLSKASFFAFYLELFFFLVFIVSISSSCIPEPFILNVWPQKYMIDFVAKQKSGMSFAFYESDWDV